MMFKKNDVSYEHLMFWKHNIIQNPEFQNGPECSRMFQNLPECSRMLKNVPECSRTTQRCRISVRSLPTAWWVVAPAECSLSLGPRGPPRGGPGGGSLQRRGGSGGAGGSGAGGQGGGAGGGVRVVLERDCQGNWRRKKI